MDTKIYVVGSSRDKFLQLDDIREKFYIDQVHKGNNIDFLNPWYCELTGLHYLLFNTNEPIIGLEHYRTYFYEDDSSKIIGEDTIKKLLNDNDIICGRWEYGHDASLRKSLNHLIKYSLPTVLKIFSENNPEWGRACELYLKERGGYHVACNMFIARRELIMDWYMFIMPMLVKVQELLPLNARNGRREGYITEFLFGAWLEMTKRKIRYSKIIKYDKNLSSIHAQTKIQ